MAKFCDEFFKETNSDARKRELFVEFAKKLGVKPYSENKNVDVQQQLQVAGLINAVKSDKAKAVAADLALSWKYPNNIYEIRVIVEMMKKNIFDERISAAVTPNVLATSSMIFSTVIGGGWSLFNMSDIAICAV